MVWENLEIYDIWIARRCICDAKIRKMEIFTNALEQNSPLSSYYHHAQTQTHTHIYTYTHTQIFF